MTRAAWCISATSSPTSPGSRASRRRRDRRASRLSAAELNLANVDLSKTIGELSLTRTVLFVPPSMLAADLMARMQATRTQMALVIDEYGGTDGLVSLEDIVEMVVGDIEDEHDDQDEPLITEAGDGVFVVDGKAEIDEVAKVDRRCVHRRRAWRDGRHDRRHDLQHARSGAGPRRGRPCRSRLRVPRARRRPAPGQARAHRRGCQGRAPPPGARTAAVDESDHDPEPSPRQRKAEPVFGKDPGRKEAATFPHFAVWSDSAGLLSLCSPIRFKRATPWNALPAGSYCCGVGGARS